MERGNLVSNSLKFVIVSLITYLILVFFVIPFSYAGNIDVGTTNLYNLTVLLYSFFVSFFVNAILFKAGKKRKWFFE